MSEVRQITGQIRRLRTESFDDGLVGQRRRSSIFAVRLLVGITEKSRGHDRSVGPEGRPETYDATLAPLLTANCLAALLRSPVRQETRGPIC